jgi:hypothetical protein
MPHITTHVNFSTPLSEGSSIKVWHCALVILLIGFVAGYLVS